MQTAFDSDLVRDSKLKTTLNGDTTRHIIEIAGRNARQRKIQKEQLWKRAENLGQGTFGSVWLERLVGGESVVNERAVKVIKKQVQKPGAIDYSRELETIAKFSHPKYNFCFVESFGWFESESYVCIAMEYFPLGDLQTYLSTPLLENEVQQICFQILEGLESMHCNGFAHRDLKPSNILVKSCSPDWWVKIGDFGISKRAEDGLTALRSFSGTLGFLAPEILSQNGLLDCEGFGEQRGYTVAVDLWSLGEIVFRALTNEPPFRRGLASYIKGTSPFPYGVLQAHKVSIEGCDMLRDLLRPMPADRLTAEAALRHPWIASQQKFSPRSSVESERSQPDDAGIPSRLSDTVDSDQHSHPLSIASAVWSTLQNDTLGGRGDADIQLDKPTESTASDEKLPEPQQTFRSLGIESTVRRGIAKPNVNSMTQRNLRSPGTDSNSSKVSEGLASQSVRLNEEQLRREEEKVREIEDKIQREIKRQELLTPGTSRLKKIEARMHREQRQELLDRESQLKEIEARMHREQSGHIGIPWDESYAERQLPSIKEALQSQDTNNNPSDGLYLPLDGIHTKRPLPPIEVASRSPVNRLDLAEYNQYLVNKVDTRQVKLSTRHTVDQSADHPQPAEETTSRAKSLGHARRESILARRARREQAKDAEANAQSEVGAELEHTPSGSSRSTEIKPVYLKGLFAVSTTSSKPPSYIQSDIIRVLGQLGIQWKNIKGGFNCRHNPYIDQRDTELNFEILIVKVPLLSLHGIQFRKIEGGTWQYKNMAQMILSEFRL